MDAAVAAASATGMYVMATNFSNSTTDCATAWSHSVTLWSAIAGRYANNTNVIYELANEPDYMNPGGSCVGDLAAQTDNLYHIIRAAAPNTALILWSLSSPSASYYSGVPGDISATPDISYSNAVVGVHAYDGDQNGMRNFVHDMNNNGRGVYMTEYGPCQDPGSGNDSNSNWAPTISNLESLGIDWIGSCNIRTVGGSGTNNISVFWPSDR
jgi:hypothetical protein